MTERPKGQELTTAAGWAMSRCPGRPLPWDGVGAATPRQRRGPPRWVGRGHGRGVAAPCKHHPKLDGSPCGRWRFCGPKRALSRAGELRSRVGAVLRGSGPRSGWRVLSTLCPPVLED